MTNWQRSTVLVILTLLALTQPTLANGQQNNPFPVPVYDYKWDHLNLTFEISSTCKKEEVGAIQLALVNWVVAFQKYAGRTFFTFQPSSPKADISFQCKPSKEINPGMFPASEGQTVPHVVNGIIDLASVYISNDPSDAPWFKAIAKHEMGHVLGLGHSSNPNDLMYPLVYSTSKTDPSISRDDIVSVMSLYSHGDPIPEFPASGIPILLIVQLGILTIGLQLLQLRRSRKAPRKDCRLTKA